MLLEEKINDLKKKLIEMAALAESMTRKSIKSLLSREKNPLLEVLEVDEPKLNNMEIEIEGLCTNLIALHQPEAKDLRTILMILSMNDDLERVGDLAVNLSANSLFLIERPDIKPLVDIPKMAEAATKMLKDSIDAFVSEDSSLARNICKKDDFVDNLRDAILRELIGYMSRDSGTVERSIRLIEISRILERIADLSTNISEDVIFMVEGKVIKHHAEDRNEVITSSEAK